MYQSKGTPFCVHCCLINQVQFIQHEILVKPPILHALTFSCFPNIYMANKVQIKHKSKTKMRLLLLINGSSKSMINGWQWLPYSARSVSLANRILHFVTNARKIVQTTAKCIFYSMWMNWLKYGMIIKWRLLLMGRPRSIWWYDGH